MFSKPVLKFLRKTVEDGYKWGCLPYRWDPSNSNIVITVGTSRTRKCLWHFNIAFYTIYMVYLCGRYLQRQLDDSPLRTKITTEYVLSVYILPLVLRWHILLRYAEIADFLNSFQKYFRELDSLHQRPQENNNSAPKKVKLTMRDAAQRILENNRRQHQEQVFGPQWPAEKDGLFTFIIMTAFSIRWLNVLTALTCPEMDHLLTSVLPDPRASPIWQRALLLIPHVYIWWTTWDILNFTVAHGLAYVRATVVTIIFAK